MLDLKRGKLIKVEQATEEEGDTALPLVNVADILGVHILFDQIYLPLKHFFVHLKSQLMNNIDLGV